MTRFARAKGSKSSNEKAPEDSTPWEVMKEQLLQAKKEKEDSKNREEAEQQRIQNYENFLKEQKVQKRKATWCDFPETPKEAFKPVSNKKKKNKNKTNVNNVQQGNTETTNTNKVANDQAATSPNKKRKKNKNKSIENNNIQQEHEIIIATDEIQNQQKSHNTNIVANDEAVITATKKKKKNKNKSIENINIQQEHENIATDEIQNQQKPHKHKKNKNKLAAEATASTSNEIITQEPTSTVQNKDNVKNNNVKPMKKKKDKKLVNGQPQRRKDINDKSFELIINGKEVELMRVDGFPVMKKDAERLNELKRNMIQKGIPKSEIQRTMKLERRRAEKALARVRREVCYNCRKGGHNLSDCPDLKNKIPGVEAGEGICFKCGSTEHRQFECKVQRDKEFRFATCFICKEPGHIARQCPDNPKGLYPNGGSCNICGDVTHLRKDCPTTTETKVEKSIKLSTLDSTDDVEGIGQQASKVNADEPAKKVKKIKF